MTDDWPRNIVPYDEEKLLALSSVEHIELCERAKDVPLVAAELSMEERALSEDLVKAGLLRWDGGLLVAVNRHLRDAELDVRGRLEHKQAIVKFSEKILRENERALLAQGPSATAAMGAVTLPERPDVVARAFAILAEAEDQLRALREDAGPTNGASEFRVLLHVGSR